ncbi:MAG: hypothetical protein LBU66_08760, partial [Treponema sp.]|nr:hypothetical protein [Treponema sp.]
MKTIKSIIIICFIILAVFGFNSCDDILSLGEQLNIAPPSVTIEKPDFMQNISGEMEIAGTASDRKEIVILNISIERTTKDGQEWKLEMRGERGNWQRRSSGSSWENSTGEWKAAEGPGLISWALLVDMQNAPEGEYLITAGAVNNVSNAGALVQRRVIIDTTAPVVDILSPYLEPGTFDDVEPVFDEYELRDPSILSRLHNQQIIIQYKIDDEFSI